MKKYYPVDFDEKGNAVLGNAKSNPTSNGFIPTTWVPGGESEEEGNGVKSVSISPAITTTPALDSLFPIYYDDLTEEQKHNGIVFNVHTDERSTDFVLTVTPTSDWHGFDYSGDDEIRLDDGEPMTVSGNTDFETPFEVYGDDDDIKMIHVTIRFNHEN